MKMYHTTANNEPALYNFPNLCLNSSSQVMRPSRRKRTLFSSAQLAQLEQYFLQQHYLNAELLNAMSVKLGLGISQIKIWFKNRRRREKLKYAEIHKHDHRHFQVSVQDATNDSNVKPLQFIYDCSKAAPAPMVQSCSYGSYPYAVPAQCLQLPKQNHAWHSHQYTHQHDTSSAFATDYNQVYSYRLRS